MKRAFWVAITSLAVIVSLGCLGCLSGEPSDTPDTPDAGGDGAAGCDPSLTYASFGMQFLNTYCGRCHGFTQQSAQMSGSTIVGAAGTGSYMPPSSGAQPSAKERADLVAWIACGAP